jgi:hypothetical protein
MEMTNASPSEFLEAYRESGARLIVEQSVCSSEHTSVTATFKLAFEKVSEANSAAADLLRLCAFLHPESIPEEVFTEGTAELGDVLGSAVSHRLEWMTTRAEVGRYSLLTYDCWTKTLSIHRVVQAVLQDLMTQKEQRQWAECAVRAVNRAFADADFTSSFKVWPKYERLVPQAKRCAELIAHFQFSFIETVHLLNQLGLYLYERGLYTEAEPVLKCALSIAERTLQSNNIEVARPKISEIYLG